MVTCTKLKQHSIGSNYLLKIRHQLITCPSELDQSIKFEKNEIAKKPELVVIEPAQTEWASPTVFAAKKVLHAPKYELLVEISMQLSCAILFQSSHGRVHRLDGRCDDFSRLDLNSGFGKSKLAKNTVQNPHLHHNVN